MIRLPAFSIGPPSKVNWTYNPRRSHVLAELFETRLKELIRAGLCGEDLMATFISSRICPFQKRTHKLCYMSGPLDPNRVSTVELDNYLVFKRVRAIFKTEMPEDWTWGLKPFTRERPPPAVSLTLNALIFYCFHNLFSLTFILFRLTEVRRAKGRGCRGFVASVDCGPEYPGRWGAGLRRIRP